MSEPEQQISAALDAIEQDGQRALSLNVGHLAFLELFGAGACESDGCTRFRDLPVYVIRRWANPHHWEFCLVGHGQHDDDIQTLVDNLPLPAEDELSGLSERSRRIAWAAIAFGALIIGVTAAGLLGAFR